MKFNLLALACALTMAFGLSMGSFAGSIADADSDGIPDNYDNCSSVPNGPLAATGQCFTNQDGDEDGFGNSCDSDFNNDGATGVDDLSLILANINNNTDAQLDLNCDGAAGVDDLSTVLGAINTNPGPSGLACQDASPAGKGTCPPL